MKEQFLPYKLSKAMQEIGFDEKCLAVICDETKKLFTQYGFQHSNFNPESTFIPSPLYQQAFDFFRETHGLHVSIELSVINFYDENDKKLPPKYFMRIERPADDSGEYLYHSIDEDRFFATYHIAREVAVEKCIEIIANLSK